MIPFACHPCGMKFQVKDEFAGRTTRCPACKRQLVVPQLTPAADLATTGPVEGVASSLDRAGVQGNVTLMTPTPVQAAAAPTGASRYVLQGEIARGGMGAVMRAIDRDIRREVAVKFMLNDRDPRHKARFVEEAQITGQLEHPNIVPIHELGLDAQKRLFFAMKMVRGRSLAQVVEELGSRPATAEKEWPLGRLLSVFVSICHALGYAHSRGVVHRDLKPANVMVGDFGEVYVMDWGLAKVLSDVKSAPPPLPGASRTVPDATSPGSASSQVVTNRAEEGDLTQEGAILGTPVYMPPEQAQGRIDAIDQRSDVYSLGAILYEMLTLQPPVMKEGGFASILYQVLKGDIWPPERRAKARAQRGLIPPELSAVAMKALAKEPTQRYQTVEELRRDIERFQEGRSVSAKVDTAREQLVKFVRRNKSFSATAAAALLVLAVVGGFALRVNYTARVRAEQAQHKAEAAHEDYQREQREKEAAVQKLIPVMVRLARQLLNDGKVDDARSQLEVALAHDADNAEARLLKAHLLISDREWSAGRAELAHYLRLRPDDAAVKALSVLCASGSIDDPLIQVQLAQAMQRQGLDGLTTRLLKESAAGRQRLLAQYQKPLDATWPQSTAITVKLILHPSGEFRLHLGDRKDIVSLDPLKGMVLHSLEVSRCVNLIDVEALKGLPLTSLLLQSCPSIRNLEPVRGLRLTYLRVIDGPLIPDLEPLRGMPLKSLELMRCNSIRDLGPLSGLPLTSLEFTQCQNLPDLEPLRNVPLVSLVVDNCSVRHLESLRGKQLTHLRVPNNRQLRNLEPLRVMPLLNLDISGCPELVDLEPLRGMKLTFLSMQATPKIRDLRPLEGMPLEKLAFDPRAIETGMDVLRGIKSLHTITPEGGSLMPAAAFWKRYDAGEFRK